jgi:hypothetical protein
MLTVAALLAATAVPAVAQTLDAYNDVGGQTQGQIGGVGDTAQGGQGQSPTTVSAEGDGGALPFTGADLALLVGAGVVLALAGVGMRRLTRAPGTA